MSSSCTAGPRAAPCHRARCSAARRFGPRVVHAVIPAHGCVRLVPSLELYPVCARALADRHPVEDGGWSKGPLCPLCPSVSSISSVCVRAYLLVPSFPSCSPTPGRPGAALLLPRRLPLARRQESLSSRARHPFQSAMRLGGALGRATSRSALSCLPGRLGHPAKPDELPANQASRGFVPGRPVKRKSARCHGSQARGQIMMCQSWSCAAARATRLSSFGCGNASLIRDTGRPEG